MAKKKPEEKPKVAKELDGLELNIDSFGEIQKSLPIDKINEFLNKKVDDKKLRDRDDLDEIRGASDEEE
ncbi:hypothetical protein [Roseivirga sp.]|uniref:hypothetical protein n=1 Tax=Roseivirga sp. TaxID=1964215 RepID=UPI003B522CF3